MLRQTGMFIKRNAPTILTSLGGVGVVATAVATAKATPKALTLLEEAKNEKGEELTKLEVVKVATPSYIPAILFGVGTIACIFSANILNKRNQAAIMSAYALLDSSFKEYKAKVVDVYGEDANNKIKEELAKDGYEETEIEVEDDKKLFYDEYSGRYFNSTLSDVMAAEYRLNRDLIMRGYVYLNEFYEYLGLEPIESGFKLGWSPGANLDYYWQEWVDFNHHRVTMDDGLECCIVTMLSEPILDFEDYC